jgi:cytochrome c
MKRILIAATAVAFFALTAGSASAQEDKAKAAGCLNCHGKVPSAPAFDKVAAKYKGQADAADKLTAKLTKGHHGKKPSEDDAKAIVSWILGMA